MPVSQYRNKMAIFEKIAWDIFSLRTSHIFFILCLTDWGIFETRFKTAHNLKTIMLRDAPVTSVLAVLSGQVKEVELYLHEKVLFGKVHLLICMQL